MLLELLRARDSGFGEDIKTHIACLNCQGLVGKSTLYQMNCVLNHSIVLEEHFEV